MFFAARDGIHGAELWRSDGTEAGTVLVKDIHPAGRRSVPSDLVNMGGTLLFTAKDGIHGRELWRSDGTEVRTVMVKDINGGGRHSRASHLTASGGRVFFSARDGIRNDELWRSDGTNAGTILVKDINEGGGFRVGPKGRAYLSRGTLRVRVVVAGDGSLVVGPVARSLLRRSRVDVASAGRTTILLRPTRAGLRILRQNGALRVRARFTFTPCGGTGSSVTRRYTLRLD